MCSSPKNNKLACVLVNKLIVTLENIWMMYYMSQVFMFFVGKLLHSYVQFGIIFVCLVGYLFKNLNLNALVIHKM
jgi:hypothetical protein